MGAIANPLVQPPPNSGANMVGWGVPTSPGSGGVKSASGTNPYMPFINPTAATSSGTNPNPYAAGFPANEGGYPTGNPAGSGSSGSTPPAFGGDKGLGPVSQNAQNLGFPADNRGQKELFTNLKNTFGEGMATTLMNFLSSGAGFNQQAINNLIAAMQPGFNKANQDLLQNFSAGGSRFSSGAALGLSNLQSQEQLNIGSLESQMYEKSVSDYMDVMMGISGPAAKYQASIPTGWDIFQGIIGDIAAFIPGGGGSAGKTPGTINTDSGGGGGFGGSGGGDFGGSSAGGL